jgi:hypothetical protein
MKIFLSYNLENIIKNIQKQERAVTLVKNMSKKSRQKSKNHHMMAGEKNYYKKS